MVRGHIGLRGLLALSIGNIGPALRRAVLHYRLHASEDQVRKLYDALRAVTSEPFHPQRDQIAAGFRAEIQREQELQRALSIRLVNLRSMA